jgi:hypothetical protein
VTAGAAPYDGAYFERYARQADTDIGRALMAARCDLVERYTRDALIDVGIGSGAFIEARQRRKRLTYGWDVNPVALAWLDARGLLLDPHVQPVQAVSLWDTLEHIEDFQSLLGNVIDLVFLSLPIFRDLKHVMRSKHFRPDEHCWYFTQSGLVSVMGMCGFEPVELSNVETRLGREDIGSFVFRRKHVVS